MNHQPQPLVTIGDVLDGVKPVVVRMAELIDEPEEESDLQPNLNTEKIMLDNISHP